MSITLRAISLLHDKYQGFSDRQIAQILEKKTNINSKKWQNLLYGSSKITEEMTESLGVLFPENVYWIITGKTNDVEQEKNNNSLKKELNKKKSLVIDKKGNLIIPAELLIDNSLQINQNTKKSK